MKNILSEYWEILNDAENFFEYGYRHARKDFPEIQVKARSVEAESVNTVEGEDSLEKLKSDIQLCNQCHLCETRNTAVSGKGARNPELFIIAAFPDMDEDNSGLPYVGKSGQYLERWLKAINLDKYTHCYLSYFIKCLVPDQKLITNDVKKICGSFLQREIALVKPKLILLLGDYVMNELLHIDSSMDEKHGQTFMFSRTAAIPIYDPETVLRNPELRQTVWQDLKKVQTALGQS